MLLIVTHYRILLVYTNVHISVIDYTITSIYIHINMCCVGAYMYRYVYYFVCYICIYIVCIVYVINICIDVHYYYCYLIRNIY